MLNPLKLLILGFAIASALLSSQARTKTIAGQTSGSMPIRWTGAA